MNKTKFVSFQTIENGLEEQKTALDLAKSNNLDLSEKRRKVVEYLRSSERDRFWFLDFEQVRLGKARLSKVRIEV